MKDLNDLRRDRKAAADKVTGAEAAVTAAEDALDALTAEGTTPDAEALTAAQAAVTTAVAAFDASVVAFNVADGRVKRREQQESIAANAAQGDESGTGAPGAGGGVGQPAVALNPADAGVATGLLVHALANAKGDVGRAVEALDAAGHSGVSAALSGATDSAGGVTIPQAQSAEIIALLKPRVAVRASGARVSPMPAGELRDARQTGSATAAYGVENGLAIESEPTFSKTDKAFKTLRGLVPIGNALLRHSMSAMNAQFIRDDLIDALALTEDLAFLRGDGSADDPVGIRSWCLAAHKLVAADATAAEADAKIRAAVDKVEDANIPMNTPGWIMRASTKNFLASLRWPTSGQKVFPSIEMNASLMGYPIRTTSQVPNNLGVGADETEITFADFNEVVIGDSLSISLATSTEASFVDTNGDTISAFQRDLTLMRAISEHDLAPRHDEGISMITAPGWSL
ncbi:MAG: phage major capsid protein [Pseudoruegeria sp.]